MAARSSALDPLFHVNMDDRVNETSLTTWVILLVAPVMKVFETPHADWLVATIMYTVPLQLLSYHVAVLKGADADQPQNLVISVTVE